MRVVSPLRPESQIGSYCQPLGSSDRTQSRPAPWQQALPQRHHAALFVWLYHHHLRLARLLHCGKPRQSQQCQPHSRCRRADDFPAGHSDQWQWFQPFTGHHQSAHPFGTTELMSRQRQAGTANLGQNKRNAPCGLHRIKMEKALNSAASLPIACIGWMTRSHY